MPGIDLWAATYAHNQAQMHVHLHTHAHTQRGRKLWVIIYSKFLLKLLSEREIFPLGLENFFSGRIILKINSAII